MIGKFLAKIKDYGVTPPSQNSGQPQITITFEFEHEGSVRTLTWYGSLAGGAREFTLKTLLIAGLQPQMFNRLDMLMNGIGSNLLNTQKDLEIDVQEEPKQDGSGMRTVVKWVNDPAAAPQIKKIDQATNSQYFGQNNFAGDLYRIAQELGLNGGVNNGGGQNHGGQNNNYHNPNNNGGNGNNGGQWNNNNGGNGGNAHHAGNGQNSQNQNSQNHAGGGHAQNASHSNGGFHNSYSNNGQNNNNANGNNGFNAPF